MKNFGEPELLQYKTDLPIPVPRGGEVLVKNEFIGVNYVDVFVALLPFPKSQPFDFLTCHQILAYQDDGICPGRNSWS